MPIYHATFRSGSHQFFDMGVDEAIEIQETMAKNAGEFDHPWVHITSTGATLRLDQVDGFQHYISEEAALEAEEREDE